LDFKMRFTIVTANRMHPASKSIKMKEDGK